MTAALKCRRERECRTNMESLKASLRHRGGAVSLWDDVTLSINLSLVNLSEPLDHDQDFAQIHTYGHVDV